MPQQHRNIDEIVIHCSATKNGAWVTAAAIDGWHRDKGYRRPASAHPAQQPTLRHIGYHYVVYTTGAVISGRGEDEVGAHCKGHNKHSLGICLIGTDKYSAAQWRSLRLLVQGLRERIPSIARVLGHRDTSPDLDGDGTIEPREWLKTCPGFDVSAWLGRRMEPTPEQTLEAA